MSSPHLSDTQLIAIADASALDPQRVPRRTADGIVNAELRSHLGRCVECQRRLDVVRAESTDGASAWLFQHAEPTVADASVRRSTDHLLRISVPVEVSAFRRIGVTIRRMIFGET